MKRVATPLVLALAVGACQEAVGPETGARPEAVGPAFVVAPAPTAQNERVLICKDGPAGTYWFNVDGPNNGGNDLVGDVSVDAGACLEVTFEGGSSKPVTVYEDLTKMPVGVAFDHIEVRQKTGSVFTTSSTNNSTVTVQVAGTSGAVITFYNKLIPPPPPPPATQGCTPGYWKQKQHFDSWTAPYTPTTLFSSVFEDAFPGMTLLDVLNDNGNKTGLEALGRHTVAALLNGASAGVSYGLTDQEVIDAFNAVYPGTKNQLNAQKDKFAAANERGCPLN